MLTLALIEAALQLVPQEIQSHPQIKQYAKRRQKAPDEVLLDRAFHHAAMQKLARTKYPIPVEKMGRPDIIHNTLLQVLETPLNWEGQLRVFIHTQAGNIISINPKVRLPKNYVRFVGLIEQLFKEKQVPMKGKALLTVEKGQLEQVVQKMAPTKVIGFSTLGKPELLRNVADRAGSLDMPLAMIGGFPRGHFTERTKRLMDEVYCIDKESLDAWIVAGRFVYDLEWSLGLAKTRLTPNQQ
jgi:rRNA small subunit pseudouridine methyltransferase Nep1